MKPNRPVRTARAVSALLSLALAALTLTIATNAARAADPVTKHPQTQRLVVRGVDTVADGPCAAGVCRLALTDGSFRGTPVGTGAYSGSVQLFVAAAFPNGEGGVCAPIEGEIVLGAGTANRLVLALSGDSCQDGAGDVTTSSFTNVARFVVKHGSGKFAHSRGKGLATFAEDAADHERMTLVGHITL